LFAYQPTCFEEAIKEENWVQVMDEEIDSIDKNDTWDLVELLEDQDCIGVKWAYKTKFNEKGEVEKHKARLVAKDFSQQPGVDYSETFAPVARLDTTRVVLATVVQNRWKIYQMDVKSAFLKGILEEEVYVEKPLGYVIEGHEDKFYRLKKSLYGLKKAPRVWYSRIDSYLISTGFNKRNNEPTLYTKVNQEGQILIVFLYVDDMIFRGNFPVDEFKETMKQKFEMTDLGLMRCFLGIEVLQSDSRIFAFQSWYVMYVLKRFRMMNCMPTPTPIPTGTKLSKEDAGSNVDPTLFKRFIGSLTKRSHWKVDKIIMRYIVGTTRYCI